MLAEHTLVLNKSWMAVNITTVRNALGLLFQGSARAIAPDTYETYDFDSWADLHVAAGEPCIRTVSLRIKVPEIILLLNYDEIPKKRVTFSRRNIYKRDNFTCQYCGSRPGSSELTIDHIIPRSRGGKTNWLNCVLACTTCNKNKGNRLLSEAGMKLLQQPYEPPWNAHLTIPLYQKRQSWEKFISDKYWDIELESDLPPS